MNLRQSERTITFAILVDFNFCNVVVKRALIGMSYSVLKINGVYSVISTCSSTMTIHIAINFRKLFI